MSTIESQLLAVLNERRAQIVRIMTELAQAQPAADGSQMDADTVEQMANGFISLLSEELDGGRRDARALYLETLIPALVASGAPLKHIVGPAVAFAVATSFDLVDALPPGARAEGVARLARFWGDYAGDLAQAGAAAQ